jgi:hypothetical protein
MGSAEAQDEFHRALVDDLFAPLGREFEGLACELVDPPGDALGLVAPRDRGE